ncbi:MAG: hypothetical protein OXJ37_23245 [Bryobacterales bacterium]|nr:hypothetical protein [Bryobacterales bacterium]MDE0620777.1 hypothetical protein [Bryobacterales bacterium]
MTDRIRGIGEEMLVSLSRPQADDEAERFLLLVARDDGDAVNLEFEAATDDTDLEDQLALLGERVAVLSSRKRSPRACCATPLRPCATSSSTMPT